jgi:hypothetical protein
MEKITFNCEAVPRVYSNIFSKLAAEGRRQNIYGKNYI